MPGAAYSAGRAVVFSMTVWTCSLRETQRHSHTDTQRHAHRLSLSQLQPGIVRVRVATVFWAMAQLPHASLSVQCKRPQHGVESGLLSELLLIKRTRNTDVIMVPAWMLLIERTRNTDVIMVPAWMLLIERTRNTDVIMVPAWMLLIERTRNTDVIMVPAWMLLIKHARNMEVIMVPAWMLLIKRTTYTDVFMPSASASAMRAEGFTPCVVAAAFLSPRQVPKCCSCHAGQARRAWARTHFLRVYGPSEPQTKSLKDNCGNLPDSSLA